MSTELNVHSDPTEPEAPIVQPLFRGRMAPERPEEFSNPYDIRILGSSTQEKDREEYFRDIEERKARSAEFEAKRLKPKPQKLELERIDALLDSLHESDVDFTNSYGKPNTELLTQREIVAELTARLAEERVKLDAIGADLYTFHGSSQAESGTGCVTIPFQV